MKRLKFIIISMLIMLVFCGCESQKSEEESSKINVVTSFYPIYIATSNIVDGVPDIELNNLTSQTTGCLHDYQITTADMIKLSRADILVINGDGMESFIDKAMSMYQDLKIINSSEGIKENHEEIIEEEPHDEENEHDHGENNHYWVSISLYIEQVKNIKEGLIKNNPENAEFYEKNANNYISKLENLKEKMHAELEEYAGSSIVTFHEAFDYFAEEFDLKIAQVIQREPGTYPSSLEIAETIRLIKNTNVKAIFVEPQYSRTAADTIARETNVKVYTLDPVVTGDLNKDAYVTIMEQNLEVLKEALSN